ncbi:hypothetical protein EUGRSUZ_F01510 [Eucalyptus grandis]|uniref:Uncharacterized protein n=2 Tax=Eucalyptus grandis TaxID=71139 RepID=A0ACC3KFH8_EUCGR|nr:hypothetical protein EUGRSUZ_F01510 [Eucalyptus grandis]
MRMDVSWWMPAVHVRLLRLQLLVHAVQQLFSTMKIGFVAISFMQKPSLISPNKRIGYPFLLKLLSR